MPGELLSWRPEKTPVSSDTGQLPEKEGAPSEARIETTQSFLQNGLSLDKVTPAVERARSHKEAGAIPENELRDSSEYSFEDAVAQLSPDYASAVIVKELKANDIKKLAGLPIEVGIAVIGGKIVLFTTGREGELRLNPAAIELLQKAELIAHVHVWTRAGLPSFGDLSAAGDDVEYVISGAGIYAYNRDGLVSEQPLSFGEFAAGLKTAARASRAPEKQVRSDLNEFIRLVDEYNRDPQSSELFRSGTPTVWTGDPRVTAFAADGAAINLTQSDRVHFRFDYNLPEVSSSGGVSIGFSSPQDYSAYSVFTFWIRTDNVCTTSCVRIEFKDTSGQVASVLIPNLTLTAQNVDISKAVLLASNPLLDFARIQEIAFAMDRALANGESQGFVEVTTGGGLHFEPQVNPSDYDAASHTVFPGQPVVSASGANSDSAGPEGLIVLTQNSETDFQFLYDLTTDLSSFVYAQTGWGYFDTNNVFQGTPGSLPQDFILGVNGAAGSQLKVEVVDVNRNTSAFILNLTGTFANYTLTLAGDNVPAGFDRSKIAFVNFVLDQNLAQFALAGQVQIKSAGLAHIPAVDGTALDTGAHTLLPNKPAVTVTGANSDSADPEGLIVLTQNSETDFQFLYDLTTDLSSFVYAQAGWGYFDEGGVFHGTAGALPGSFVFAADGPAGSQMLVEVTDTAGKAAKFRLNLAGSFRNYTLDLTGSNVPAGFNINSIAFVNFVLDQNLAQFALAGQVQIKSAGLSVTSVVNGMPNDPTAYTTLANQPVLAATGSNTDSAQPAGQITLNQKSGSEFEYIYDLSDSETAFVYAQAANGYFDAGGLFQGTALVLSGDFVLAARGAEGSIVKVEVVDTNQRKVEFDLVLKPLFQNYTLSLTGANVPALFQSSSIAQINFVTDRRRSGARNDGIVEVQIKGLQYVPLAPDPDEQAVKNELIASGQNYFEAGVGIDPVTHFPYDSIDQDGEAALFSQPTLIGFYLQMLSDRVKGASTWDGMTVDGALTEIGTVMDQLASVQASLGWYGLLPWINLDPVPTRMGVVGMGDNANLSQSLAVVAGALESSILTEDQKAGADAIIAKIETFLENQTEGYMRFVDLNTGQFWGALPNWQGDYTKGDYHMDRLANEFRGAVAFVLTRYHDDFINRYPEQGELLIDSLWSGLQAAYADYTTMSGVTLASLAPWEGSAFQMFWPLLRNDERDYIGFNNALLNYLVAQTDWAAANHIPGFLSASMVSDEDYKGRVGIPALAESPDLIISNMGSTYALASAYLAAPDTVLEWLTAIWDALPGLMGPYGFYDAARSGTEIAHKFLGIDVASTVLGLTGAGPDSFETYLKKRGMEYAFNSLYDEASRVLNVQRTSSANIAAPPVLPSRSLSVFNHTEQSGGMNDLNVNPTDIGGVTIVYRDLTQWGGQYWNLDQLYDASDNQLGIIYGGRDSPQQIKIQLKNSAYVVVYEATLNVPADDAAPQRLVINLPDDTALADIKQVTLLVDPEATGDSTAYFDIYAIDFQLLT